MPSKRSFSNSFNEVLKSDLKNYISRIKHIENGGNLYGMVIDVVEKSLIDIALAETGGNQTEASHILGVNRNTLRRKIKDHKIDLRHYSGNGNGRHN